MGAPVGPNQIAALTALKAHNGGTWYAGCGWVWDTPYKTTQMLDSLVRRGLARRDDVVVRKSTLHPDGTQRTYTITEAGRALVLERTKGGQA